MDDNMQDQFNKRLAELMGLNPGGVESEMGSFARRLREALGGESEPNEESDLKNDYCYGLSVDPVLIDEEDNYTEGKELPPRVFQAWLGQVKEDSKMMELTDKASYLPPHVRAWSVSAERMRNLGIPGMIIDHQAKGNSLEDSYLRDLESLQQNELELQRRRASQEDPDWLRKEMEKSREMYPGFFSGGKRVPGVVRNYYGGNLEKDEYGNYVNNVDYNDIYGHSGETSDRVRSTQEEYRRLHNGKNPWEIK